jgi:hypothetical protein
MTVSNSIGFRRTTNVLKDVPVKATDTRFDKRRQAPNPQKLGASFDRFCEVAQQFWLTNTLPSGDATILVELMTEDIRVGIRSLTIANAIRRVTPARVVIVLGADSDWLSFQWTYYDKELLTKLAHAYGADDVIDIHEIVDERVHGVRRDFEVAGTVIPGDVRSGIDPETLEDVVEATTARVARVPRVTDDEAEKAAEVRLRSVEFSDVYDGLLQHLNPVAVVTSHVDYNHWGLAVESAMRFEVPVIHVQTTGGLKAYMLGPERRTEGTFREHLTREIGQFFEDNLWANRDLLRRSAELTAWRAKSNLGRPSWWRGGGVVSSLELTNPVERADLRKHAMQRLGFDESKPVVVVFNHAVSDALGTNREIFDDLADWFERTAEHAAQDTRVNWLFQDHPAQFLYDVTGFFDTVKERWADHPHLQFRRSFDLSKNIIWSLVDLGVTVRGSVSAELPVYGVPALQAGWSEWSQCGFSMVAQDRGEYWRLLDESIEKLLSDSSPITEEQVERARLWQWFYRGGGDVASMLVQHWDMGQNDSLIRALTVAMRHVESDGEAALQATQRMWTRKEPILTRFDFTDGAERLAMQLGAVTTK